MRVSYVLVLTAAAAILGSVESFGVVSASRNNQFKSQSATPFLQEQNHAENQNLLKGLERVTLSALLVAAISLSSPFQAFADTGGASLSSNAKITTGGASTLQSGRTITITRGVNLDRSDFSGQNLKGVAFQQSIVRDSNFKDCNLVGSSFFDATIDGSNFENADMSLSNVEMAQFNRANLKNTVMREVYVSGATLFEGVKSIEGSDWTDTYRKLVRLVVWVLFGCCLESVSRVGFVVPESL
jgi:uncharacterized protein YjbI with pentapeptide repeats